MNLDKPTSQKFLVIEGVNLEPYFAFDEVLHPAVSGLREFSLSEFALVHNLIRRCPALSGLSCDGLVTPDALLFAEKRLQRVAGAVDADPIGAPNRSDVGQPVSRQRGTLIDGRDPVFLTRETAQVEPGNAVMTRASDLAPTIGWDQIRITSPTPSSSTPLPSAPPPRRTR